MVGEPPTLVVGDLSFISLRLVLPALTAVLAEGGELVMLVKPQFEVGKERVGAGGVVRDPELRAEAVRDAAAAARALGLTVKGVTASPLPGPSGNVEYSDPAREGARSRGGRRCGRRRRACRRGGTPMSDSRSVLITTHTGREAAVESARLVIDRLLKEGLTVRVLEDEAEEVARLGVEVVPADERAAFGAEIIVVLGGDGTLLRAAEISRPTGVPLLGVNLGHVGFLAEAEVEDLHVVVDRVVDGRFEVEERMTVDVTVRNGTILARTWALNEASVEKRDGMLEVVAEIDGHPLSRWGCDGVICATSTGSTAYAFSAGGPVVWPQVEALLVVPNSAHALFARPLVVAPTSTIAIELLSTTHAGCCGATAAAASICRRVCGSRSAKAPIPYASRACWASTPPASRSPTDWSPSSAFRSRDGAVGSSPRDSKILAS